ncbi:RNA-binding component of cleavage and polyadenylation factor [Marasmius tenuissimus]|uniref:mRNA 3'-end-processing protein n=1 Tax=Marasmius tenuissimus TaxID=585030 RepID=A0ABR3AGF8_9AGAR
MTAVAGPSFLRDVVNPQFHQNNFNAEAFAKGELGLKLDKGHSHVNSPAVSRSHAFFADDQICRLSLTQAGCPLGPLHCPLRHTIPSNQNFQPPKQLPTHPRERERLATVCKHWLRGLCKKGDACEFLHEYNLRRMPECWWFAKYGYCSAGDECLYAHPKERKIECPDYNRGFCKLDSNEQDQHALESIPKPGLPPASAYDPPSPPSNRDLGPPPPGYGRYADFDRGFPGGANYPGAPNPSGMQPRRNLDDVLCFKCGEKGHYANHCRNRNVPGNRGGVERTRRIGED